MRKIYFYGISRKDDPEILYIGQHHYINLNDSYMGSGKLLKELYKKEGKENFSKIILETFEYDDSNFDEKKLIGEKEKFWIDKFRSINQAKLNISDGSNPSISLKVDDIKKYRKKYNEEYYLENKEKYKELHKKNYLENKEKYNKLHKKWLLENKEYVKEYNKSREEKNKEYREKNKEHIKEKNKEYYLKNKDIISEKNKKYREKNKEYIKKKKSRDKKILNKIKKTDLYMIYKNLPKKEKQNFRDKFENGELNDL